MPLSLHNTTHRILSLFMRSGERDFSVRGIARLLDIHHTTVARHVAKLFDSKLIKQKQTTLYPVYYANTTNEMLRLHKQQAITRAIVESGLLDHLDDHLHPDVIILFGSCAQGTYTPESDIDLYIQAAEHDLDLKRWERLLGRPINVLFASRLSELSKELRNNILNGNKLRGFLNL